MVYSVNLKLKAYKIFAMKNVSQLLFCEIVITITRTPDSVPFILS